MQCCLISVSLYIFYRLSEESSEFQDLRLATLRIIFRRVLLLRPNMRFLLTFIFLILLTYANY